MTPATADALLAPVTEITGFMLACLADAATGMVVASAQGHSDLSPGLAAAGAADITGVLSLLMSGLAVPGSVDDVLITLSGHILVVRPLQPDPAPQVVLLVVMDRQRANLAMARRQIRDFCARLTPAAGPVPSDWHLHLGREA